MRVVESAMVGDLEKEGVRIAFAWNWKADHWLIGAGRSSLDTRAMAHMANPVIRRGLLGQSYAVWHSMWHPIRG